MRYEDITIDAFRERIEERALANIDDFRDCEDRYDVMEVYRDFCEDDITGNSDGDCPIYIDESFTALADSGFCLFLFELDYNMRWLSTAGEVDLDILYCIYFLHDKDDEIVDIIVDYLDLELED